MKTRSFKSLVAVLTASVVLAGCAGMSPTLKGGAIGAGVGAATGVTAGAILGEPGKGAGVGAVVGGVVGLLLGEMYSRAQKQQAEANTQRPPSESYSTTLTSPSTKTLNEPLLLVNGASASDEGLAENGMFLMKELLTNRGVKFEEYTIDSVAKHPNSSIVVLRSVRKLGPPLGYDATLSLIVRDMEPKDFSGVAPTLSGALSKALFGK